MQQLRMNFIAFTITKWEGDYSIIVATGAIIIIAMPKSGA